MRSASRPTTPGPVSDYTGQDIYYRSIQHAEGEKDDRLTIHDYLWRWDTDWFWCSRAFGAQNPKIRRFWPRRYRRSSFYWKLIGYDQRFNIADRIEKRNGRPPRERVVQDIEVPIERSVDFVDWFLTNVPIEPIWLCPLRLRDRRGWPLYPIRPHHTYVNIGFWSSVPVGGHRGRDEPADRAQGQRARRTQVAVLRRLLLPRRIRRTLRRGDVQDRKEDLRSRFTAPRPLFEGGAATMRRLREEHRTTMTTQDGTTRTSASRQAHTGRDPGDLRRRDELPLKFTAYDGSTAGPDDATLGLDLHTPRGTTYLATAPGDLGLARAYVSGDLEPHGVHPGDPYELLKALAEKLDFKRPPARVLANIVRSIGLEHLKPIAPPPQEALPRWRRIAEGLRHSKTRDAEAIHHHYDVSNTFYEWVLGPSMTYTCACYPARTRLWRRRRTTSTGWCSRSCG